MKTESELAWAAGFYDGEGSTQIQSNGKGRNPGLRMMVVQKDRRPLDRFCAAVGVGRVYGPYESQGWLHVWATGGTPAEQALMAMWFHLSEPKREQAMVAWKRWRERPVKLKTWAEMGRTERKRST